MGKFCSNCGAELTENQEVCLSCGAIQKSTAENGQSNSDPLAKSKLAAGLLGILLGGLGVHNFYLGYTAKAVIQLVLSLVGWIAFGLGPLAATIWGIVEGVMILTGSISTDATGRPLKE